MSSVVISVAVGVTLGTRKCSEAGGFMSWWLCLSCLDLKWIRERCLRDTPSLGHRIWNLPLGLLEGEVPTRLKLLEDAHLWLDCITDK